MNKFKIAHVREQGIDLVIVPLDDAFGRKSSADQQAAISSLQICSGGAGLKGTVVVVWRQGGQMHFIAPNQWHAYFKSLSWNAIMASLNKELTCG